MMSVASLSWGWDGCVIVVMVTRRRRAGSG